MGDCVVSTDFSATLCFGLLFLQSKTPTIRRAVPRKTRRLKTETTVTIRILIASDSVAVGDSDGGAVGDSEDAKSAAKRQ